MTSHGHGAGTAPGHGHGHGHDHGHSHDSHGHHHDHDHSHPSGLKGVLHGLFVPHSHDTSDSIDDALEAHSEGIRALKLSLMIMLLTTAAQAAVVAFSGSVALLADTIHNLSDALTAVPLWIAFGVVAVHLHVAYARAHACGQDFDVIAGLQLASDQRAGDDRAEAFHGEDAIDGKTR